MERYVLSARLLHWIMAGGFVFMWACGYAMTSLATPDSALEESLFGLHISVGVVLIGLLILRIIVRLFNTPPALPTSFNKLEKIGSHLGHYSLYLLPAAILVIGWAEVDFGGHGVTMFGIAMPKLFPTMDMLWGFNMESTTEIAHRWLAYIMLGVALVHIAAVAKHRWVDGHDVLGRMGFGKQKSH